MKQNGKKHTTIHDVARLAGVSVASVSYAINGINKITPATRQHIFNCMETLDYKVNTAARCLSNGASGLIGVALPITEKNDNPGILLNNPFYTEFISGVESIMQKKRYDILISGIDSESRYKDWAISRRLDGIIMLGIYPQSIYHEIRTLHIPVVLNDAYEPYALDFHRIMIRDEEGGYMAAKYLIGLGHKNIAFISGNIGHSPTNRARHEGYCRAHIEAGIPIREDHLYQCKTSYSGGYETARKIAETAYTVTACFAAADTIAIGLMKGFADMNIRVPSLMSVVGFDDIQFGKFVTPGLTTIKQDIFKKGVLSAQLLLDEMRNPECKKQTVLLEPELIIRDSAVSPAFSVLINSAVCTM